MMENENGDQRGYFPLEWECEAFQEVKSWFLESWRANPNALVNHFKENDEMKDSLLSKGTKFRSISVSSDLEGLEKLFFEIVQKLISVDPYLERIYVYNLTLPEDREARKYIRNNYLPPQKYLSALDSLRNADLLRDSALAKECHLAGIPMGLFFIGEMLLKLSDDCNHFMLIDFIKDMGLSESISELRKRRIYRTSEGKVYDYTPFFKSTVGKKKTIFEVFCSEDFEELTDPKNDTLCKELSQLADDDLCFALQKSNLDIRQDKFFGDTFDNSEYQYIIRFGRDERKMPIQLLPKWHGKIEQVASKYKLTTDIFSTKGEIKKDDERQEGMIGLLSGALSWDRRKGPATNWLSMQIVFGLQEALDILSTEAFKKQRKYREKYEYGDEEGNVKDFNETILKERFDSLNGSLDEPIEFKDGSEGKRIDILESKESLSSEGRAILSEIRKKYPKIKAILDKQANGQPLTPLERQTYKRIISSYKNSK